MTRMRFVSIVLLVAFVAVDAASQGFDAVFGDAPREDTRPVTITGEVDVELRAYFDNGLHSETAARTSAGLSFTASGETAEAIVALKLVTSEEEDGRLVAPLIDEVFVTSYFGFGHLTAGRMRVEWGKGDGVHAIDPLNARDQTSGPAGYIDSRIPETMVALSLYAGATGRVELVYKPFFRPTRTAGTGRWAVVDVTSIPGYSTIEPVNVRTLEYSQGAARITGTLGPADLGALYYAGFMPEPGYKITTAFTGTDPMNPDDYTVTVDPVYTRAQLFGVEAAAAVGPFTVRGEAGYWLSEDTDGSAPELYNSRLVYLAGADVMIPGTRLFTSVQVIGSYTTNASSLTEQDVDRMRLYGELSTEHQIIAAVELPFVRDSMRARLAGTYSPEARGYIVMPDLAWTIADGVEISVRGTIIGGEEPDGGHSPFFAWRNNDSVSVSFEYQF